ncbi:Acyl-CoA dehydrogenase; probable dibenzothiophene desulfurization enzyme [Devosia sp. DBB001]|nr:Acyl-CoA dehydrogenase; probable dibenzothiophene desulfurization enzyme [Devosia sp. DBB001]
MSLTALKTLPSSGLASPAEAIETAERLAVEFLADAIRRDRERVLPQAEYDQVAAAGLLAIRVPRRFGGLELGYPDVARVVAAISGSDASLGQLFVSSIFATAFIGAVGSEAQQADFYARQLGGITWGNASSEVGGKTAATISTNAVSDGDDWVITGRKFYSTGALLSALISVVCQDEDGKPLTVLVPNPWPGLSITDDWDGMGQRTTASGTLTLDQVRVPKSHGFRVQAARADLPLGAVPQLVHCAIDLGIARRALEETLNYVRTKARPWSGTGYDRAADDPYILALIGELTIRLHAAEALLERGGLKLDAAFAHPSLEATGAASIALAEAKVLTTEIALEASTRLFQLCGASSTSRKYAFDRYWRDARTHTVHDPLHWKFHAVGNHALNGSLPSGQRAV